MSQHEVHTRRRRSVAGLVAVLLFAAGLALSGNPAGADPSDVVIDVEIDTIYDGVDPLPPIDDDPQLPPPAGYTPNPGEDLNGEIATLDTVGYRITMSVNLAPGSTGEHTLSSTDIVLDMPNGAWLFNDSNPPAGCNLVIITAAGSRATCRISAPLTTGDVLVLFVEGRPNGDNVDGSSLVADVDVTATYSEGGTVVSAPAQSDPATIRTRPMGANLNKALGMHLPAGLPVDPVADAPNDSGSHRIVRDPATGAPTDVVMFFPVQVELDPLPGQESDPSWPKGYVAHTGDTHLVDRVSSASPASLFANAELIDCGPFNTPMSGQPLSDFLTFEIWHAGIWNAAGGNPNRTMVPDAGTWTCTQNGQLPGAIGVGDLGTDVDIHIADADMSGRWFPSHGTSHALRDFYFAANAWDVDAYNDPADRNTWLPYSTGFIALSVPWADVVAADDQPGDGRPSDPQVVRACVDADQLNISTDPAVAGVGESDLADNIGCVDVAWTDGFDAIDSEFTGGFRDPQPNNSFTVMDTLDALADPVSYRTPDHDNQAMAGQSVQMYIAASTSQAAVEAVTGFGACHVFDASMLALEPFTAWAPVHVDAITHQDTWHVAAAHTGAMIDGFPTPNPASDWLVEYAAQPTWPDYASMTAFDCDQAGVTWVTDPTSLPGGAASVNAIRISEQAGTGIAPGSDVVWAFQVTVDPAANPGDIAVQTTTWKADGYDTDNDGSPLGFGGNTPYTADPYDPIAMPLNTDNPESASFNSVSSAAWFDDRLFVAEAIARARKTDAGALPTDYDAFPVLLDYSENVNGGELWGPVHLSADLYATGPMTIENVRVYDASPPSLQLEGATQAPTQVIEDCNAEANPACISDPAQRTDTGWTTYEFVLGDIVHPGGGWMTVEAAQLYFRTPLANLTFTNGMLLSADNVQAPSVFENSSGPDGVLHLTDHDSVDVITPPVAQIRKYSPTPWIEANQPFTHQVAYANPSSLSFSMDIIDVLPHNGDPYLPASDYSGSLGLPTIDLTDAPHIAPADVYISDAAFVGQQSVDTDSSGAIEPGELGDLDPDHPSNSGANAPGTGNWACTLAQVDTPGCPTSAGVTAIRFVTGTIAPDEFGSIDLHFSPTANAGGDVYTNRAGGRASGLSLPIFSDHANTRVFAGSIGDLVFHDVDGNGVFDPGTDAGIPGVRVELYDTGGALGWATITDANGRYVFNGLNASEYYVEIPASEFAAGGPLETFAPAAGPASDPLAGNEDADHDGTGAGSVVSANFTIGLDQSALPPAPVGPLGDEPTDGSPSMDPSTPDPATYHTVDFAMETLSLPAITLVKYVQEAPAAPLDLADPATLGADADTSAEAVQVLAGSTVTYRIVIENTGNTHLSGVTVDDAMPECAPLDRILPADVAIDLMAPGDTWVYECSIDPVMTDISNTATVAATPSGPDGTATGDPDVTDSNPAEVEVELLWLGNQIWLEVDDDGVLDAGETPASGVQLHIYLDADADGAADGATPLGTTATDASGLYNFTDLIPGTYVIEIDAANFGPGGALEGWRSSTGHVADHATADNDDNGVDPAAVTDAVWSPTIDLVGDLNPDPRVDFGFVPAGTPAVQLVKYVQPSTGAATYDPADDTTLGSDANVGNEVAIDHGADALYRITVTNTGGLTLTDVVVDDAIADCALSRIDPAGPETELAPGERWVYECELENVTAGLQNTADVSANPIAPDGSPAGGPVSDSDIAIIETLVSNTIGDTVWLDENRDGLQDPGEPGVPAVNVEVLDAANQVVASTVTDAAGNYSFVDLPIGTYTVVFDIPSIPPGHFPTALGDGTNPTTDSDAHPITGATTPISITPGYVNLDIDFGVQPPREIDLAIVKTLVDQPAAAGEVATWSIVVRNNGPDDHPGPLTVVESPGPGLTLSSISAPAPWICTIADGEAECLWPDQVTDGTELPTIVAETTVDTAGTTLVNDADVTSDLLETDITNNTDDATVQINSSPPTTAPPTTTPPTTAPPTTAPPATAPPTTAPPTTTPPTTAPPTQSSNPGLPLTGGSPTALVMLGLALLLGGNAALGAAQRNWIAAARLRLIALRSAESRAPSTRACKR